MTGTWKRVRVLLANNYLINILTFSLCASVTYLVALSYYDKEIKVGELFYLILGLSFALVLLASYFAKNLKDLSTPVFVFLTTIFGLSLLNHLIWKHPFLNYGDAVPILQYIDNRTVFPRWLVGMVIINTVYWAVWKFPPFISYFKTIPFLKFFSTIFMGITSLLIVKKYGKNFSVILAVTNALWFLFLIGYNEYYPFIISLYLLSLILIFDDSIVDNPQKSWLLCAFYSVLPLVYIGFAPISAFVLIYLFVRYRQQLPKLILTTIAVFFLTLNLTWGSNYPGFFKQLYIDMNFGDQCLNIPKFMGKMADDTSIYFKTEYALSSEHLKDLFYMVFFGGGVLGLLLLILSLCMAVFVLIRRRMFPFVRNWGKFALFIAIVLQQLYYLVFLVPKLGVRADIDLFVFVYLTSSYFAGFILDRLLLRQSQNRASTIKAYTLSAMLGYQLVIFFFLAVVGIPNSPL